MVWLHLFCSFSGRLRRSSWWAASATVAIGFIAFSLATDALLGRIASLSLLLPFGWMMAALSVKRLHGGGRSAGQLLWLLLPVAGPLLIGYRLACQRGTVGENQYGQDPFIVHRDYLQVDIQARGRA